MGSLLLNALSFADNLLLLSPDNKTTCSLIRILEEWCQKNKLSVNVRKSGILRSGELSRLPPERFFRNKRPLQFLDEEDPEFEDHRDFDYLGMVLPQDYLGMVLPQDYLGMVLPQDYLGMVLPQDAN